MKKRTLQKIKKSLKKINTKEKRAAQLKECRNWASHYFNDLMPW